MSNADYDPRNQRMKNDRPRYRDDRDDRDDRDNRDNRDERVDRGNRADRADDYPDSRTVRRPRHDEPPPYAELKPAPREARRGGGSDLDDDPRADRQVRAMPRAGARRPDYDFAKDEGRRTRSGSRDGPRRDPRDVEPVARVGKPGGRSRNAYDSDEDDHPKKIRMRDYEDGPDGAVAGAHGRRGGGDPDPRRGKGYDEPVRAEGKRRDRDPLDDPEPPRRRARDRDPYDEPEPPRRKAKERDFSPEPPRRRATEREPRRRDDRYDDEDDEPRPRRRRDDKEDDRGYRPDGRDLEKSTRRGDPRDDDRGYRSDGRDMKKNRDGYGSDRGPRRPERSGRDDRRDRDRDRDRDDRERDRDRKDKKKKGGLSFNPADMGKYIETGQKHYKSVKPIIDNLTKMYLDSKK